MPVYASPRTAESHRVLVRRREVMGYAPAKARRIAAKAMTRAAWVKNHPPDLINAALEWLAQARLEPPTFSTKATSADRSVLEHALTYWSKTRDFIPARAADGRLLELAFASANWLRAIRDRKQPGTSRASGLGTASESISGVS